MVPTPPSITGGAGTSGDAKGSQDAPFITGAKTFNIGGNPNVTSLVSQSTTLMLIGGVAFLAYIYIKNK